MKIKKSLFDRVFSGVNGLLLLIIMFICVYPMIHILAASLSEASAIASHRGLLFWPKGFSLDSYGLVFENPYILSGYGNTILYVVAGTLLNLVLTTMAAYALSRHQNRVRQAVMLGITFTMYFSGGLIPTYMLINNLGIANTRWVMLLPGAVSAYNLIIMRTYFAGVPAALEESAKIDGANDFTVLARIFVPLAKPVIAVMTLFYGVGHWNAWFNASLYIQNRDLLPLQVILREILIQNSTQNMTTSVEGFDKMMVAETVKYATIIVATLPILALYPFLQKYFVKGVMVGSIKG
ncbi:MAG: carbohydrate ABC transporter permease [Provencibacterium sp.]|jgi:putative aldouronate transport system permease protein|nr:carbohydrate ABC transporter permease [Provencibacterium sp.]